MTKVNHYLTDLQVERLRGVAGRTGLTVAELIRRAVDALLEKESRREKHDGRAEG